MPFTLSAATFSALERFTAGTVYPARPFACAELPATDEEAAVLADFIEDGIAATWRNGGRLDLSAPFAACVLAHSQAVVGPAVFTVACPVPSGGAVPRG